MNRQKKFKFIFAVTILSLALFSCIFATKALADPSCADRCDDCHAHPLLEGWPASPFGGATLTSCSKLGDLVKYLYGWGVSLGGIAVFISLVIAGFEYITSIGNPGKMKDAVSRIESAAIGLALLLGSWAIFNIINPNITTIKNTFSVMDATDAFNVCTGAHQHICCQTKTVDPNPPHAVTYTDIPGCNDSDWNCCRPDDYNCMKCQSGIQGCNPNMPARAGSLTGVCCCTNDQCQSNFCDPTSSTCQDMPKVCIKEPDKSASGCDIVRFYNAPGFAGTVPNVDYVDFSQDQFNSANFLKFIPSNDSWYPQSLQAFKYEKRHDDGSADITSKLIPCGSSGCGCAVVLCLQMDLGGTSKCAADTADKQNSIPMQAYQPNIPNTNVSKAFVINDETKKSGASQAIDSIGTNLQYIWSLMTNGGF
jgi:hypothetical protein